LTLTVLLFETADVGTGQVLPLRQVGHHLIGHHLIGCLLARPLIVHHVGDAEILRRKVHAPGVLGRGQWQHQMAASRRDQQPEHDPGVRGARHAQS